MLDVHDVRLARTTSDPHDLPRPARPHIAFVGRSNVGKSSLLNALFRRRGLARTSRTPGKTQTLNYFAVGDACYFVDLPGYGYARVPDRVRATWGPMVSSYLEDNPRLVGVVALVDGRHDPSELDLRMVEWLAARGLPTLIVLTKADKVARGARQDRLARTVSALAVDPDQAVWFSSRTGEGRDSVFAALRALLEREVA